MLIAHYPTTHMAFDVLIRHGQLIDGTGNPWVRADVAIVNGRVASVGFLRDESARRIAAERKEPLGPALLFGLEPAHGVGRQELTEPFERALPRALRGDRPRRATWGHAGAPRQGPYLVPCQSTRRCGVAQFVLYLRGPDSAF
jgi:hypothetical protein